MQVFSLFGLTTFTTIATLLLGGGTRAGMLSDAILQLLAVPLLLLALWHWLDIPSDRRPRWVTAFCVSIALIFSIQLLPLPPAIWTALPHRESIIEAFRSIDRPLPWMPMSLSPFLTRSSLLALIAPLGVFLAASNLHRHERRRLALLILPVSAISVFLGLVQVAQGNESPLRFFAHTNPSEAVGFFANRNHFSALVYSSIVVASAWFSDSTMIDESSSSKSRFNVTSFVAAVAAATLIVVLMSGQAMARSRAGIALTLFALIGAFALAYANKRRNASNISTYKLLLGTIAFAVALSVQFALYRVLIRFDADMLEDTRWTIARRTIEAARAYLPFGSGFGTFVPVYATYERPEDALINAYINHAHNDFLELYLESGLFGVGLAVAFCGWWGWRSWRLWRHPASSHAAVDEPYARAATLIVALLLIHSFVDYPLRTTAMLTFFALACALMIDPPTPRLTAQDDDGLSSVDREPKHRKNATRSSPLRKRTAPAAPSPAVRTNAPSPKRQEARPQPASSRPPPHGTDWPEEWREK